MKKHLIALVLLVATGGSVKAQTGLYAGLDFGFNSIWIANQNNYGYTELEYERTFGAMGGAILGYRIQDTYAVQIGFNYVGLGQDYFEITKDFGPPDTIQNKQTKVETYRYIRLKYLQIPIMFRYMSLRDEKLDEIINLHLAFGPTFGFLLSADQYYEADILNNNNLVVLDNDTIPENQIPSFKDNSIREEDKDYFSGFDFGVALAAGVDIYISEILYVAPSINIYYGLIDLNSAPTRDIPDYKGASHNLFAGLNLSLIVNLGEE